MDDSILISVKKVLGLDSAYDAFDTDILMHINAVFGILKQLGVGPDTGFSINDASTSWSDYEAEPDVLNMVKTYMYMKVRYFFDPPMASSATSVIEKSIAELEWRLNVAVDKPEDKK